MSDIACLPEKARPLDARLARLLVRPLVGTSITPNDLTTLRLVIGLFAVGCLAAGSLRWANFGAWLFVLSNFVDHTDGELARMSGKSSRWGFYYDIICDVLIHVLLFAALGYGLRDGSLGLWPTLVGAVAGAAIALVFWLTLRLSALPETQRAPLPALELFDIEDVMYLFPLITLFDVRLPVLFAAVIGAPVFACWVFRRLRRQQSGVQEPC